MRMWCFNQYQRLFYSIRAPHLFLSTIITAYIGHANWVQPHVWECKPDDGLQWIGWNWFNAILQIVSRIISPQRKRENERESCCAFFTYISLQWQWVGCRHSCTAPPLSHAHIYDSFHSEEAWGVKTSCEHISLFVVVVTCLCSLCTFASFTMSRDLNYGLWNDETHTEWAFSHPPINQFCTFPYVHTALCVVVFVWSLAHICVCVWQHCRAIITKFPRLSLISKMNPCMKWTTDWLGIWHVKN